MKNRIDSFFQIAEKGSSVSTEVLAGISAFLALSYIFVVNPAILSEAGIDRNAVLFATIIASAAATLAMGLWARLPFVLAPGMEMNAYVAFFAVGSLGLSWQAALGAVFWSGVIFLVLTLTGVRERIIEAIPERMKAGLSLCVGVFLGLIALKIAGVLSYDGVALKGIGDLFTPESAVLFVSLAVVVLSEYFRFRAGVLVSIVLATLLCHLLGIGGNAEPATWLTSEAFGAIGQLDVWVIFSPKALSVILILFLVDFYGSVAKFIGLTTNTSIVEGDRLPRMREALVIDGAATVLGSVVGTSSITTYVESGVGIGVGGRTGLTAVVCGLLMLACFGIAPLIAYVPVVATTGALLWVAAKLCPSLRQLKSYSKVDMAALVLMLITVIATFAIDRAMLVGFCIYLVADLFGRRKPNPYLVGSAVLLAIGVVLQIIG